MFIIGDIHCRRDLVDAALRFPGKKIFLGDLVDDYSVPPAIEQAALVKAVLDAPDTICLLGNHEASYLYRPMRCSGYQESVRFHLWQTGLSDRIEKECKPFVYLPEERLLLSHAGLTRQIWDEFGLTFENLEERLTEWWRRPRGFDAPFWWIGTCRGGGHPVGGLLWCDWRREFEPVPGLNQIMGHTRVAAHEGKGEDTFNLNIDSLPTFPYIVAWENGWQHPRLAQLVGGLSSK